MSEDFISQFIDALCAAGYRPNSTADIKADERWNRLAVNGDRNRDLRYKLRVDSDRATGFFVHSKEGHTYPFNSKSDKKLTKDERAAIAKRIKADQEAHAAALQKEYDQTALECRTIWSLAIPGPHAYAERKGVPTTGARVGTLTDDEGKVTPNVLLIPVYKNNRISSLQRIWENGFKAFWEGGDVTGGYCALSEQGEDKSNIVICEGYATGQSIRLATGFPVVVAFNAGNLLAVALVMRQRYPDSRIIIAADNDRWTFNPRKAPKGIERDKVPGDDPRWQEWADQGRLWNPGLEKAQQAAVKIGAHVIFPDVAINDKTKRTDFNDIHLTDGLDVVKNRISVACPASPTPLVRPAEDLTHDEGFPPPSSSLGGSLISYDEHQQQVPLHVYEAEFQTLYRKTKEKNPDWRAELFFKDEGGIKGTSLNNTRLFIENHEDYAGLFCYDEFAHEKVVAAQPPWEEGSDREFQPRTLRDEDVTQLAMHIERKGINLSLQNLRKVLDSCIVSETRNPAREYFTRLVWDGVPRLDTWLREYAGCKGDDHEYLAAIGRKWLTAAVARVMRPGIKFDHILVLEGEQNLGKSMMLRELATIHGRAYFDDTIKAKDLPNPSTVPKLQGVLIVELAEMSGFAKMDPDEAKQVISTQYDRIVKKYANEPSLMPRMFVLAGTLNRMGGYLTDATGNRRYWPATCTKINMEALRKDKEQLWAEAAHLYEQGEELYLRDDLYRKAEDAQRTRAITHPWQSDIEGIVKFQSKISMEQLWESLHIGDRSKRTRAAADDITKIMSGMGWEYRRKRVGDERVLAWYKKDVAPEPELVPKEVEVEW